MSRAGEPAVRVRSVTMRFGSNLALADVSLDLRRGEVHALVGENGAGKSTLVNLITHRLLPTSGAVEIVGHPQLDSPKAALEAGIAAVYQDRKLAPNLTGLENIFFGREPTAGGLLRRREMRAFGERMLGTTLGFPPEILDQQVQTLGIPEQQAVAVAKAMLSDPSTMIFDEPSEALSPRERQRLFELVRTLRDAGVAVVYITHALDELEQVADQVTVLRDGRIAGSAPMRELDKRQIVRLMIGEELDGARAERRGPAREGPPLLEAEAIETFDERLKGVSFTLYPGEVVGIAGLEGSGRGELLRALVGLVPLRRGTLSVDGHALGRIRPRNAWREGIALVPRDRHRDGLLPGLSVAAQMTFASLGHFSRGGFIRRGAEQRATEEIGTRLRLRTPGYDAPIEALSGGNQQKTVVGRAVCANSKIWLLEDPTAAIDVRSRADVHELAREFAAEGGTVLVASSDVSELASLCDRVLVLVGGSIAEEVSGQRLTEPALIRSQYGVEGEAERTGGLVA